MQADLGSASGYWAGLHFVVPNTEINSIICHYAYEIRGDKQGENGCFVISTYWEMRPHQMKISPLPFYFTPCKGCVPIGLGWGF